MCDRLPENLRDMAGRTIWFGDENETKRLQLHIINCPDKIEDSREKAGRAG